MLKMILSFLFVIFLSAGNFAQNTGDNVATAKAFVDALARKDFTKAYAYFGDSVKAKIPLEAMPQIWAQINGEYGQFQKQGEVFKTGDDKKFTLIGEFEKASVGFLVLFDEPGKIISFTLDESRTTPKNQPKYEAPNYANPASFTEKEVTVGAGGEWALPATLTVPKGDGKFSAVVLVHGSGPGDRDETGSNPANKPFKDLAWGLASKGIAVLRYEKRSRQYGAKLVASIFTVKDESIDDALLAVELLRNTAGIDPTKIYVLGHSLGGYLIPRIGARDAKIAGFISLAGATRPLEDIILEQNTYFANLDGKVSKEEQAALDKIKLTVGKIKSLKDTDKNSTELYYGAPAAYYLDLKNYNPPQAAKSLKQPILILQGERDYQVTMTDFQNWKNALGDKDSATFKTYPKLNHLFMPGDGVPSPADYKKNNHVPADVVEDIAFWILKARK